MRDIKFRQAIFKNSKFDHWHYWGFVGYREEFIGPITITGIANIWTVKPSQEYTGLKDKNSKEIYEGDIVHFQSEGEQIIVDDGFDENTAVIFKNGQFQFKQITSDRFYFASNQDCCEIIGNIRENPKLLGD